MTREKEMETKTDRREFKRFPLEFNAEVVAKSLKAETFRDKTLLKNISGEGAKFITLQYQNYYIGQPLDLVISLPGTKDVKACMKVKATVVRIEYENSQAKKPDHKTNIALKLVTPLEFERLDPI